MKLNDAAKNAMLRRESGLVDDRSSFDPTWSEIRDNLLPFHGRNLSGADSREDQNGFLKSHNIVDGTATRALAVTAAGMQAGINSPARPWFKLGYADRALAEYKPVRVWLDQVETILRRVFSKSNLYGSLHSMYLELAGFGTNAMVIVPDFQHVVRAIPFTVGEYWLGINDKRRVDQFYRKFRFNARQMVGMFGEANCSTAVKTAYAANNLTTTFKVHHYLEPNDDTVKFPFMGDKEYRSIYHEDNLEDNRVLKATGTQRFNVIAPRWHKVGNMAYGFGPGHATLNDIKGLQKEKTKQLIAIDKHVDPSLVGPSTLEDELIDTTPGGVTFDDSLAANSGLRPLHVPHQGSIQAIQLALDETRNAIRGGLFTDLFTLISNSVDVTKTATEVAALKEEKMTVLGPVLESTDHEVHGPLINLVFFYAEQAGLIPPPPPEVAGLEIEIEYISILAQAQKMIATTGIEQVAGFVGNLTAVFPEARHKFNATEAVDEYADAVGVSARVINSDEEVEAMKRAEAEQAQAQQALEATAATAQQAKVLSETDMGGNTALNALLGGRGE